jgi:hypothetical protein
VAPPDETGNQSEVTPSVPMLHVDTWHNSTLKPLAGREVWLVVDAVLCQMLLKDSGI